MWLTFCALHNWLLEVDSLAKGWEHGVQSDWKTEADHPDHVPFVIKRLKAPCKKGT